MQYRSFARALNIILPGLFLAAALIVTSSAARAGDAAFTQFIASLWPEAQAAGVSRATFDRETRGLEPDYALPDLILPGRPATGARAIPLRKLRETPSPANSAPRSPAGLPRA